MAATAEEQNTTTKFVCDFVLAKATDPINNNVTNEIQSQHFVYVSCLIASIVRGHTADIRQRCIDSYVMPSCNTLGGGGGGSCLRERFEIKLTEKTIFFKNFGRRFLCCWLLVVRVVALACARSEHFKRSKKLHFRNDTA